MNFTITLALHAAAEVTEMNVSWWTARESVQTRTFAAWIRSRKRQRAFASEVCRKS